MEQTTPPKPKRKWPYVVFVLVLLWLLAMVFSSFASLFLGIEGDTLG